MVLELQAEIKKLRQDHAAEIADLKAQLKLYSGNSSQPPSSDPPSAPKPPPKKSPTGRKPGGQPGHTGHLRERLPVERVSETIQYIPDQCGHCGAALSKACGQNEAEPTWHQVIELPDQPLIVTEHQGHGRTCACCGHLTRGKIPAEILAHRFGPNLTSGIVFLSGRCHDSKRVVVEIVQTIFGVPISLGTICNLEAEAALALAPAHAQAEALVRTAAVKNVDETGWYERSKLKWLWAAGTKTVAFFKILAGRGKAQFKELLGEKITGIICSDRWSAYNLVKLIYRQLCWSHLKRDFQKWLDRGGDGVAIGQAGLSVVKRLFEQWRLFKEGKISRPALAAAMKPLRRELRQALQAGLECADKKVKRFCKSILKVYSALWTFVRVENVEPTNNHAERIIRLAVLWRKVSFGNHSVGGCLFAERILTVVQTLTLQKRNALPYLRTVMQSSRLGQKIPSLLLAGV